MELMIQLDCTKCERFNDFETEEDTEVVRCSLCGKRHSRDRLYTVQPDKRYNRDEAGNLMETPP